MIIPLSRTPSLRQMVRHDTDAVTPIERQIPLIKDPTMFAVPSAPTRRGFLATSAAGLLQVNSYLSPSTNTRLHGSNNMPLARIDLIKGKSSDYRRTIGNVVYKAMVEKLKAPENDRFQVIN